ncbi:MAG: putative Ig domain-containing protein [Patescibacteria group bacterium]
MDKMKKYCIYLFLLILYLYFNFFRLEIPNAYGADTIPPSPPTGLIVQSSANNQPPVLYGIGDRVNPEGRWLIFDVEATDPDGEFLNFSVSNLPSSATFNSVSGVFRFRWRPDYNSAGKYLVTFTVSDGKSSDSEIITITVIDAYIIDNNTSQFSSTGAWTPATVNRGTWGTDYLEAEAGSGAIATWRFPGSAPAGLYDVFVYWTSGVTNVADVQMTVQANYQITHNSGVSNWFHSQQWLTGVWVYAGTYSFTPNAGQKVMLSASADGKVTADSVRFEKSLYPATPNMHGKIRVASNGRTFEFSDGTAFRMNGINYDVAGEPDDDVSGVEDPSRLEAVIVEMKTNGINLVRTFSFGTQIQGGHISDPALPPGAFDMTVAQMLHDIVGRFIKHGVLLQPQSGFGHSKIKFFTSAHPYHPNNGGPAIVYEDMGEWPPTNQELVKWVERFFGFMMEEFGKNDVVFAWSLGNDFHLSTNPTTESKHATFVNSATNIIKSLLPEMPVYLQYGGFHNWETETKFSAQIAAPLDLVSTRVYGLGTRQDGTSCTKPPDCDVANPGHDGEVFVQLARDRILNQLGKPYLAGKPTIIGEGGYGPQYKPTTAEAKQKVMAYLHWATLASGAAGPAWTWTFRHTLIVDDPTYWPAVLNAYKAIGRALNYLPTIAPAQVMTATITSSNPDVDAIGTWYGTTLFTWLMHKDNVLDSQKVILGKSVWDNTNVSPQLTISANLPPGQYKLLFLDPLTGFEVGSSKVLNISSSGPIVVDIPSFQNSLGLVLNPAW